MAQESAPSAAAQGERAAYDALMEVVENRITTRMFDSSQEVPTEHIEMILEAARHAPSGANAQPWHFVVVTDWDLKKQISDYFVEEQRFRAKQKMKFPTPNYAGLATAPGFVVIAADFRFVKAFPVLRDQPADSELNKMYMENAERILLQSVAAATMQAHLAAAALGYNVWWVTAIGQQKAQEAIKPLLEIPEELSVLDIMCFGTPSQEPYKRWKKDRSEIVSWNRFNPDNYMREADIDDWIANKRHKVMYKNAQNID